MYRITMYRKMMANNVLRVVFQLLLVCTCAVVLEAEGPDYSSVKNEISASWDSYLRSIGGYSGTFSVKTRSDDGFHWEDEKTFECDFPYACFQSNIHGNNSQIRGYNEKYRFSIAVSQDGSKPRVDDLEFLTNTTKSQWTFPESESIAGDAIANVLACGFQIYPFWFPDLWRDDNFILTNISYSNENGEDIATIKFVIEKNSRDNNNGMKITNGDIVLLPKNHWLILRAKCNFTKGTENGHIQIVNEYNYDFGNTLLKRQKRDGNEGNMYFVSDIELSNVRQIMEKDRSKFTLSHYGLPEPDFGERRTNGLRYTLMVAGIILIAFALWRMYQERKEKKQ